LKLARAAHTAPADAAEKSRIVANELALRIRLKLRAEGERRAAASHESKDDEHNHACRHRYSVVAAGRANFSVDGKENSKHYEADANLQQGIKMGYGPRTRAAINKGQRLTKGSD
jgi:hypothetical protein